MHCATPARENSGNLQLDFGSNDIGFAGVVLVARVGHFAGLVAQCR
jgi:hypothetical protein